MLDPALFGAFVIASVLIAVTPGPDTVFVVGHTITRGRRIGFVAMAGIGLGLVIHSLAAVFGLSQLFVHAPMAYEAVRWLGVAYLLWLAWQVWRDGQQGVDPLASVTGEGGEAQPTPKTGYARVFRNALLTNLFNPKLIVFFIAFLPQFVPAGAPTALTLIMLAIVFVAIGMVWLAAMVLLFARIGGWLSENAGFWRWQNRILAVTLGGMALWLAGHERQAG
ncbi:MAG: LysE family translocator [Alphaproteobacteria bacterium]|nr:LysE family translocator [Alphaproteobacteria bacterium SS10]